MYTLMDYSLIMFPTSTLSFAACRLLMRLQSIVVVMKIKVQVAALIKVLLLLGAAAKGIASQAVGSATVTRHATSSEIAVRTSPGLDATVSWTTAHCMHIMHHITHMPSHYTRAPTLHTCTTRYPHITHMHPLTLHTCPHITHMHPLTLHNHAYAHACPHITHMLARILYSMHKPHRSMHHVTALSLIPRQARNEVVRKHLCCS